MDMALPRKTAIEVEFDQPVIVHTGEIHLEVSDVLTHRLLYGEWNIHSFLMMRQTANPFVVFIHIPDSAFVPFAFYSVVNCVKDVILDYLERYYDSFSS